MQPGSNHFSSLPRNPVKALIELGRRLSSKGLERAVVLIGGQALYLWSLRYYTDIETYDQAYLTSIDIDYVRNIGSSIELLAETWHAKRYSKPSQFDPTPNEAIFYFVDAERGEQVDAERGKQILVDILSVVHGLEKEDVINKAEKINVQIEDQKVPIWLMNPVHCLLSRIANATDLGYTASKLDREINRIKAAIKICRGYLCEYMEKLLREERFQPKAVNYLAHYCRRSKAKQFAKKFKINVAEALPINEAFWNTNNNLKTYHDKTLIPVYKKLQEKVETAT